MERREFLGTLPILSVPGQIFSSPREVSSGSSFKNQEIWFRQIVNPLLDAWKSGGLVAKLESGDFGRKDRLKFAALESVARIFYPLCQAYPDGKFLDQGILDALGRSLQPNHADSFNWDKGEQPLVDAAILASGFLLNPEIFEKKLTPQIQAGLIEGWRKSMSIKPFESNWLLFAAMVEAAIQKWDKPFKPEAITKAYTKFEEWNVGDGQYSDGPRFHSDYYNSIIIHPFLLTLDHLGHGLPEEKEKRMKRAQRYGQILMRMVTEDGWFPPVGRSLCYRGGVFHHLAFLARMGFLPGNLSPALVRQTLDQIIRKTLQIKPSGKMEDKLFQNGVLRPGLFDIEPQLAEIYIGPASLYLCTWAFLPLGLGENHMYWTSNAEKNQNLTIDSALKD